MRVIAPIEITDAVLSASNIPEDDHPEWVSSTNYDEGERVIVVSTHTIYESVQDGNLDNDPTTDSGVWWIEISATNRWKAFDQKISEQAERAENITYTISLTSTVTGISFFGLDASSVRVRIMDGATEVYDETKGLVDTTEIVSWFTYFTWDPVFDSEAIFPDVPGYSGNDIEITVDAGTGTALVGQIVPGRLYFLGETLEGTEIGIEDFSIKERDDFGNAEIVERAFVDNVSFRFAMTAGDARRVKRVLSNLRATPAVYFAGADIPQYGATTYGFFQDFRIPLNHGGVSVVELEIEGLT